LMIIFLTVVKWLVVFVQIKILFGGVGADISYGLVATALPIAIFVGLLPITLGGMGTRDSAMIVLFSGMATVPQIIAVGLLYAFFGYWLFSVIGIFFMRQAFCLKRTG